MPFRFLLLKLIIFLLLTTYTCQTWASTGYSDSSNIDMLFYSNLNGNVENCNCGDPPLGGMSRIVTLVKKMKTENPDLLFIDGGDFMNTYPYPDLNHSILNSYNYYIPDVLTLGDQEFIQGSAFIERFVQTHKEHILVSNTAGTSTLDHSRVIERQVGTEKISIHAYLDPKSFLYVSHDGALELSQSIFEQSVNRLDPDQINIVIFHGPLRNLKAFRSAYSGFQLILFAHGQSATVEDEHMPFVAGGGADGEFLTFIRLTRRADAFSISVEHLPIHLEIEPDAQIEAFIDQYKQQSKGNNE